jgi:hypothetical protein
MAKLFGNASTGVRMDESIMKQYRTSLSRAAYRDRLGPKMSARFVAAEFAQSPVLSQARLGCGGNSIPSCQFFHQDKGVGSLQPTMTDMTRRSF